jgi:hypothetical protein
MFGMMLAVVPRIAGLATGLPAIAMATWVCACREGKSEPPAQRDEPQAAASAEPSANSPEQQAPSDPERMRSGPSIPRADLIALLLEPKLSNLTPDEARKHFAQLGLERMDSLPDAFDLAAKTDEGFVKVGYFRQDGRWTFTHLRFQVPVATAEEAQKTYEEIAAHVRDKLGEPQQIVAKSPYFARTFKLSSELDANVGAVTSFDEGRPYAALSIAISKP